MLLTIDVGNTNLTFGVFSGKEIKLTFRMMTGINRTSDEYGIAILDIMREQGIQKEDIEDVIIGSVVPQIMHSLTNGVKKYFQKDPLIVGKGTKTGIKILGGNPAEYGADRIVDAAAGMTLYGGPVLIVDYGTATTYDLISEDGGFLACVTCPGVKLSANALWSGTAKLPEIEILKPNTILARDTVTSMQAGLFFGAIGETEYIVRNEIKEAGYTEEQVKVVATGGIGRLFADATDVIDEFAPDLTLQGLRIIYEKQKSGRH